MGSGVSSLRGNSKSREVEQPRKVEDVLSIPGQSNIRETNTSPDNFVINTSLNVHASEVDRNDVEVNYYPNDTDDNTDRYLSNCFSQETPHQNSMQPPHSARSEYSEGDAAAAEMFAHTALSLGMDNDDLLFNLMYFNSDDNATFGTVMNSVQSETLALHSENNTPYKLKPASTSAISGLTRMNFGIDIAVSEIERLGLECDCAVCKDEIEDSAPILQIPSCQHFFHEECLLRWINLVSLDMQHVLLCLNNIFHNIFHLTARMVSRVPRPRRSDCCAGYCWVRSRHY